MGLDIYAYRQIRRVECTSAEDECAHEHLWVNPEFPAQADSIEGGCYKVEEHFHFRAGSYGGYNAWRERLSRLSHGMEPQLIWDNSQDFEGASFVELINFSDCEGVIGPETSAKLAKDFAAWDQHANSASDDEFGTSDDWFYRLYQSWRRAFEMAADHGAVQFR
jgi:hypothetical protein